MNDICDDIDWIKNSFNQTNIYINGLSLFLYLKGIIIVKNDFLLTKLFHGS